MRLVITISPAQTLKTVASCPLGLLELCHENGEHLFWGFGVRKTLAFNKYQESNEKMLLVAEELRSKCFSLEQYKKKFAIKMT